MRVSRVLTEDERSGAVSAPPEPPKRYSALGVAANTTIVGTPLAGLAIWALETYWKPGGAPLPDWVAGLLGGGIAAAATYAFHIGSALFQKWLNAKLDEPYTK